MERRVQDKIMQLTGDIIPEVRAAAAYALGESGDTSKVVIDKLLQLAGDIVPLVRAEAAKALGRLSKV